MPNIFEKKTKQQEKHPPPEIDYMKKIEFGWDNIW